MHSHHSKKPRFHEQKNKADKPEATEFVVQVAAGAVYDFFVIFGPVSFMPLHNSIGFNFFYNYFYLHLYVLCGYVHAG